MSFVSNHQSQPGRLWRLQPPVQPSPELQRLAAERGLHPVLVGLLARRGYRGFEEIEAFLEPRLSDLPNPSGMKGMKKASALAAQAVIDRTPILIWGDYDVDGATATALLVSFFQSLGAKASFVIPNRITHGYGLHRDLLKELAPSPSGAKKLLITVDCGISARPELTAAREMGYQIIVTDHHQPPEESCGADAVVNPKQSGCGFSDQELAGVGVAFYLACGIRQYLRERHFFSDTRPEPDVRQLLDLVALGTIADLVPLRQVNRILVKEGMRRIESLDRVGIRAMLATAGLLDGRQQLIGRIGSEEVAFLLAPMLNAAGRLADASLAVQLLLCRDIASAMPLARQLLALNDSRKSLGREVFTRALALRDGNEKENGCFIVKGAFHHGVIGIVASRLVEQLGVPVLVFSEENSGGQPAVLKGSGRSVPGVNLYMALEQCAQLLIRYGGHAMAAGMSLAEKNYELFRESFSNVIRRQVQQLEDTMFFSIDMEAEIDEILAGDCCEQLRLLEPFGPENKEPIFIAKKTKISAIRAVGADKAHFRMVFENEGRITRGMAFNMSASLCGESALTDPEIIYRPMVNRYQESCGWEARVAAIRCRQEKR